MSRFAPAHLKRRMAGAMLVFWLFALGAGWANACVLQARMTHLHPAGAATEAATVAAGHVGASFDHADDLSAGQGPCLKDCDERSRSVVKWPSGVEPPDLVMAPPIVLAWGASEMVPRARFPGHLVRPPRASVPLRTLYAHLAL